MRFLHNSHPDSLPHAIYQIGDFVIVPIGHDQDRGMPPPGLPDDLDDIASTSIIADYFWLLFLRVHSMASSHIRFH